MSIQKGFSPKAGTTPQSREISGGEGLGGRIGCGVGGKGEAGSLGTSTLLISLEIMSAVLKLHSVYRFVCPFAVCNVTTLVLDEGSSTRDISLLDLL